MQVNLLCSGSKGNACLVQSESTKILIDCGGTKRYLVNELAKCDVSPSTLNGLLITHSHSDHIRQLSLFYNTPVYTCCSLSKKNLSKSFLHLYSIHCPQSFEIGDLKILAIPTSHDSGPSMGFVISHQNEKLVYITDTGYLPSEVYPLLQGADYYIFESNHDLEMLNNTNRPFWLKARIASDTGHLCNQDAARLLSYFVSPKTKHIVLAHLSEEANRPELALETLKKRFEKCHIDFSSLQIQAALQWTPIQIGQLAKIEKSQSLSPQPISSNLKPLLAQ